MDRHSLRDLLDQHTLPPNHALSSLPPLPQTPHYSRNTYTGYDSDDEPRYEPRSQRRRGFERDYTMSAAKRIANTIKLDDAGTARLPRSATLPSLGGQPSHNRAHFETSYPTLSTRQSSLNTARNISPSKLDILPSARHPSAFLHPSSAAKPTSESPYKTRTVSASFALPEGADVSMLQDVTFGELGRMSLGNDTMSMGMGSGAANLVDNEAGRFDVWRKEGRYGEVGPVQGRPAPSPARRLSSKRSNRLPIDDHDRSTLLPSTPSKELLTSTNLIAREEPPWAGADSIATIVPSRSPRPPLDALRRTGSVRKRLPPSNSSNFLTVPTQDHAGDTSSLLPVSPLKTRHLLSDEYLLTQTKMEDESMMSMSLIMPPVNPVKHRSHQPNAGSHISPAKTPRQPRTRMKADTADMTMDIQQMMARVKPKAASGEESVMDLFRAELEDDASNTSMMSDSFIPPELRPGLIRSKSLSRLGLEKRSAAVPPTHIASPTRTLPRVRPTSYISTTTLPSPTRARSVVAAPPISSKRVSLSVGALPLPSSASLHKLDLPSRRLISPIKSPNSATAVPTRAAPPTRSTAFLNHTRTVPAARPTAKSSMPPPAVPSSRVPQPPKPRIGSTASVVSTTRTSTLPRATSVRSLPKPAADVAVRPAASRNLARPAALPQPGAGPSARSGTTTVARAFGGDAAGVSNRLPRPVPAVTTVKVAKGSMGPPSSVLSRPTAASATAKPRTLSTPATTISRKVPSAAPPTNAARAPTSRSSALPTARPAAVPATSRLPTSRAAVRLSAAPAPASSALQTGTIGRSSSKSAAAGLADIRERLDRLQARHQISRPAR